MSSAALLRHHNITLSFLPYKKEHRLSNGWRSLKLRTSRRRTKQLIRNSINRLKQS